MPVRDEFLREERLRENEPLVRARQGRPPVIRRGSQVAGEGRLTFGTQFFGLEFDAWTPLSLSFVVDVSGTDGIDTNNGRLSSSVTATIMVPELPPQPLKFRIRVKSDNCVSFDCGVTWVYEPQ